jgi:selenide,water dikinase
LLVACAPEAVDDVMQIFRSQGFARASVIGEVDAGTPAVTVL